MKIIRLFIYKKSNTAQFIVNLVLIKITAGSQAQTPRRIEFASVVGIHRMNLRVS